MIPSSNGLAKLGSALADIAGENDRIQKVSLFLDTGFPPLNKAISGRYDGGMPSGRIVEMFGPESSGKTAIATSVMVSAQQMGGIAMFNDYERSFDVELAELIGLAVNPGDPWIFKTPGTFESGITETISIAQRLREDKLIDKDAPIVVVFDSLASMVPKSKMAKNVDEQGMNDSLALAKATSTVFPVLAKHASELNMLILFLNQTREKPGVMFGDPTTTPGGKAPKFYSSVRIQLGRSMIKDAKSKDVLGQEISANCIKNKVSAPYKKASWRFMFLPDGTGRFDVIGSLIDHLLDLNLMEMDKKMIVWDVKKYHRNKLATKIEADGDLSKLMAMLPKDK